MAKSFSSSFTVAFLFVKNKYAATAASRTVIMSIGVFFFKGIDLRHTIWDLRFLTSHLSRLMSYNSYFLLKRTHSLTHQLLIRLTFDIHILFIRTLFWSNFLLIQTIFLSKHTFEPNSLFIKTDFWSNILMIKTHFLINLSFDWNDLLIKTHF